MLNIQSGSKEEALKITTAPATDAEMKDLLKSLDDMLGALDEKTIEKFARSKEFEIYDRILKRYGL